MNVDLFSPFDPINGIPVTIVFGTFDYRNIINKWIDHALSTCDHWRIICLDKKLRNWLNKRGHGTCAVYLYDLFPNMTPHSLKGLDRLSKLEIIFSLRKKLFHALAKSGRDFIHSDADAFWLQDPRPWLIQHTEFDLLASQGTFTPRRHWNHHRFVLCAGFFFCRTNVRTQNYFRRVKAETTSLNYYDQEAINLVILNSSKERWQIHRPTIYYGDWKEKWQKMGILMSTVLIWGERFAPSLMRRIKRRCRYKRFGVVPRKEAELDHIGWCSWLDNKYIYTSTKIIKTKLSNGLTVGIIPAHLVTRFDYCWSNPPFVKHIYHNKGSYIDNSKD